MSLVEQMPQVLAQDAEAWALRIAARWRASIESIIETGQLLHDAKAALEHGKFGKMIENDLPFGARTAQMLMAIAEDKRLSNPKHVSHLPPAWGTLHALTKLTDDEFDRAIEQKIIRPDMERKDVEIIRPTPHRERPENEVVGGFAGDCSATSRGENQPTGEEESLLSERPLEAVVTAGETAITLSGGLAIAHSRIEPADSLDFFPTPPWATRALFEHVLVHLERKGHCKFQEAWEPACGEGHMAEVLKEYFRIVRASDKGVYAYEGYDVADFLNSRTIGSNKVDWIITNPPFNDSADFVLKSLELAGTGVAMFVRLAWLESVGRYEKIFRDHPPTQLAIFTERVPLHKGRWENDGTTMTAYIWLVWIKGAEPQAPFWIPPGCREGLTRPEDIKRFGKSVIEGEAA